MKRTKPISSIDSEEVWVIVFFEASGSKLKQTGDDDVDKIDWSRVAWSEDPGPKILGSVKEI